MTNPKVPDFIQQDRLSTSRPTAAEYPPIGWCPIAGDAGQWHIAGSIAGAEEDRTLWRRWLKRHGEPDPAPASDVVVELPEPWRWIDMDGYTVIAGESGKTGTAWVGVRDNGQVESNHAPIEVVRIVCDAHRARQSWRSK